LTSPDDPPGRDGTPQSRAPAADEGPAFDVVFADTCIGGSTVASRLVRTRQGLRAFYFADYSVNPLGVKSPTDVRAALNRWVFMARARSSTLIVACNTASVLLKETPGVLQRAVELGMTVHSMVDLMETLLREESAALEGESVCLMGTRFTVNRPLYGDLLMERGVGSVLPLPATRTERAIAHLDHESVKGRAAILEEIGPAVKESDSIVLACTCFPLVADLVQELNSSIRLLDPARGVDDLPIAGRGEGRNLLTIGLTEGGPGLEKIRAQAPILFPGWELEGLVLL